jgi:hypothetical protein
MNRCPYWSRAFRPHSAHVCVAFPACITCLASWPAEYAQYPLIDSVIPKSTSLDNSSNIYGDNRDVAFGRGLYLRYYARPLEAADYPMPMVSSHVVV